MINWSVVMISSAITLVLLLGVGRFGGLRWWKRRRPLAQLILMVLLPMLLMFIGFAIIWVLDYSFSVAAGVAIGVVIVAGVLLLLTSYLIDQIVLAFSPEPEETSTDDS